MSEKTLKEKVKRARAYLRVISNNSSFTTMPIFEALTALETRVEELEDDVEYYRTTYEPDKEAPE